MKPTPCIEVRESLPWYDVEVDKRTLKSFVGKNFGRHSLKHSRHNCKLLCDRYSNQITS